ncbi:hypothetical protein BDQ12DRAFT_725900 [Crucibulum laeve]|uniref:Uncharacterized protein n=1 Tax=Crucibulum laeve TaxID=68775 RepID=A0A5C3M3F6_9AGAR|nr:hypothetical protein BDQ12DRAFT_725900 [Crucibulum laeve]
MSHRAQQHNPWLDNPKPAHPSIQYVTRKYFVASQNLVKSYHYRLDAEHVSRIYFHDIRGWGPPSNEFGFQGDIYLDLTPHISYILYVREKGEWEACNFWEEEPLKKRFRLPSHFLTATRYLWGSGNKGLYWYEKGSLADSRRFGLDLSKSYDFKEMIEEVLAANGPLGRITEANKERMRKEVERRQRLKYSEEASTRKRKRLEAPIISSVQNLRRRRISDNFEMSEDIIDLTLELPVKASRVRMESKVKNEDGLLRKVENFDGAQVNLKNEIDIWKRKASEALQREKEALIAHQEMTFLLKKATAEKLVVETDLQHLKYKLRNMGN